MGSWIPWRHPFWFCCPQATISRGFKPISLNKLKTVANIRVKFKEQYSINQYTISAEFCQYLQIKQV